MSSFDELIQFLKLDAFSKYCDVAAAALLVYDYILTLPTEVDLLWCRKFTAGTLLFILLRLSTLAYAVFNLITDLGWNKITHKSCLISEVLLWMSQTIQSFVIAIFFTFRIYAIWGKNWQLSLLILFIGNIVPCGNLYIMSHSRPVTNMAPLTGCGAIAHMKDAAYERLGILLVISAMTTDLAVIVLTWIKTVGIMYTAMQLKMKATLSTLLLRDGTIYFLALLSLHIFELVAQFTNLSWNPVVSFNTALTSILLSRFMLNLREIFLSDSGGSHTASSLHFSQISLPQLSSHVIGSLGAPLKHGSQIHSNSGAQDWDDGIPEDPQTSDNPLAVGLFDEINGVTPEIEEVGREEYAGSQDIGNSEIMVVPV